MLHKQAPPSPSVEGMLGRAKFPLLCPCCKGIFRDEFQLIVQNGLTGLLGIVGAEDEDSLAVEQEGVHVGDADAGLRECLNGIGGTPRLVVKLNGEDVAERYSYSGFLQLLVCTQRFAADEAVDTILCRVGNGGSNDLDSSLLQNLETFRLSTTRTALPSLTGSVPLETRRMRGFSRISSPIW